MKAKILWDYSYRNIEELVNDFIKDKEVVSISYSESTRQISCLILYKESEEK